MIKLDLLKQKHKIKRTDGFGILIIERIFDLFVIILFSMGTLFSLKFGIHLTMVLFIGALLALIFLYKSKKIKFINRSLRATVAIVRNKKILLHIIILSPIIWVTEAVIPYYILQMLGYQLPFQTILSLYFASSLVGLISMIPGGLGSVEFSFSVALPALANVLKQDAMITIMITRMITLIFAILGLVLYFKDLKELVKRLIKK